MLWQQLQRKKMQRKLAFWSYFWKESAWVCFMSHLYLLQGLESLPNITQKSTTFSSASCNPHITSRCWQEKGLGFIFLSQLSRSLCPKQEISQGSCSTEHRGKKKKLANGLKALVRSTLQPSAWLMRDFFIWWLHTSQPPFCILWRTTNPGVVEKSPMSTCF